MSVLSNLLVLLSGYYFLRFVVNTFDAAQHLLDAVLEHLPVIPTATDLAEEYWAVRSG